MNYYNEWDASAADWLENLIKEGLIPNGKVDRRSIAEVSPDDLRGFTQCHWFAGIGGWSAALRLARWPDDREVWTGSCPCQPYSLAGKRKAQSDERHLWPEMFRLMRARKPVVTFGEQVTSAIGFGWLDGICDDLEAEDYEVGAAVLGAFSVGSPHKRSRLYWVADTYCGRRRTQGDTGKQTAWVDRSEPTNAVADDHSQRFSRRTEPDSITKRSQLKASRRIDAGGCSEPDELGDSSSQGPQERSGERRIQRGASGADSGQTTVLGSAWSDSRIIHCTDGKSRRVGRSVFPLAPRIPRNMGSGQPELGRLVRRARSNRVGRLRGYGNAICVPLAAEFIRAYMETEGTNQ